MIITVDLLPRALGMFIQKNREVKTYLREQGLSTRQPTHKTKVRALEWLQVHYRNVLYDTNNLSNTEHLSGERAFYYATDVLHQSVFGARELLYLSLDDTGDFIAYPSRENTPNYIVTAYEKRRSPNPLSLSEIEVNWIAKHLMRVI